MAKKEEVFIRTQPVKKGFMEDGEIEDLLFDISCMIHIKEDGWIYYINLEDDNIIWRIRETGEDNQSMHTEQADDIESIEDGKWLHYTDINGDERRVTVRGKYDQEV